MCKVKCLALLLTIFMATGCAIPTSVGGYFENRRQDLIDVAHVDIGGISFGAVGYALPFMVGLNYQTGISTRNDSSMIQIGAGGPRVLGRKGLAAGLLWPASKYNESSGIVGKRPKRTPSGLSAGAQAGLLVGVGAEADVLEAIDFILGLACVDLAEDDENVKNPIDMIPNPGDVVPKGLPTEQIKGEVLRRLVPIP